MSNQVLKPCKGTGKAKGYGCGNDSDLRTYGLCPACKYDWATNTDDGKSWFNKQMAFKNKKNEVEKRKENNRKTAEAKVNILSPDAYRSKLLQPTINKLARLIDYGHPCIATGNYGKMNGGHYISVGANRTICLNLHNIFIQSFASNHWKSGDPLKYQQGLIETFGKDYFDFITKLSQHKPIRLKKNEMISIREKALKICKRFNGDETIRTPNERINLRNEINLELGIYDNLFCEHKL